MISFRCWFCNRGFLKPTAQAGAKFECSCGRRVQVPGRSGKSSKPLAIGDRLLEALIYGGACALIGFALSVAVFARLPFVRRPTEIVIAFTLCGLAVGTICGERGINWIGQKLRDRENG
ncbi:MAG: hypothetical protein ACKODX_07245 [Gemmata sp.]